MTIFKLTVLIISILETQAMIMRNNALMNKMMTHFQKDNNLSVEPTESPQKSDRVITLMQNVLCRNFPSIPCNMITQDKTLQKLIEKSIQQINYKKLSLEKTTASPGYDLTMFPIVNSEDLSNFLNVRDNQFYGKKRRGNEERVSRKRKRRRNDVGNQKNWSPEKTKKKGKKDSKRTPIYSSRKKIRKFYPHKIKYKDKNKRREYDSDEKLSMSIESPDGITKQHMSFKAEADDPPIWRIDYMKHGEPSLNMLGYQADQLKGKIIKTGPNVIVDENVLEQAVRRDVLHPDVYIKKNIVRKSTVDLNSEGID